MNASGSPLRFSRFLAAALCGVLFGAPQAVRAIDTDHHFHLSGENKSLHEWATLDWPFVIDPPGPIGVPDLKGINPGGPMIPAGSGTSGLTGIDPGGPMIPAGSTKTTAVSVAPDFILFRTGTVDLEANFHDGKTRGLIDVSVRGYAPGTYTVDAVTVSSTSTVTLGSLTVASGTIPIVTGTLPIITPYDSSVLVKRAVSASPAIIVVWPWGGGFGSAEFGGKDSPFPHGFNPFDIQSISLSDSNGDLVSTATLTPVSNGYYSALSPLASGTAAPDARGSALIRASDTPLFLPETALDKTVELPLKAKVVSSDSDGTGLSGIWSGPVPVSPIVVGPLPIILWSPSSGRLAIHAHGLPAHATLTYAADGTDLGTAITDSHGDLSVLAIQGNRGSLPSTLDLFSVKTVTVRDHAGNVLVSAHF